jgi:hypothetical protein
VGLDSPQKLDVVQVQAREAPSSHERIREAILRVAREGRRSNGNGSDPAAGDDGGPRPT